VHHEQQLSVHHEQQLSVHHEQLLPEPHEQQLPEPLIQQLKDEQQLLEVQGQQKLEYPDWQLLETQEQQLMENHEQQLMETHEQQLVLGPQESQLNLQKQLEQQRPLAFLIATSLILTKGEVYSILKLRSCDTFFYWFLRLYLQPAIYHVNPGSNHSSVNWWDVSLSSSDEDTLICKKRATNSKHTNCLKLPDQF